MFASYKGGAYSRPGTRFVGWSAQFGRPFPPRLIPFQFSINQGLILEFGNFYMRVISNGAQVTENPIAIVDVSQANPGVVTTGGSSSGVSATPVNTSILAAYAPGDTITLAGGVFTTPAVLSVTDTTLLSCAINSSGNVSQLGSSPGYAPGDTITLAGGTHSVAAVVAVVTTKVIAVALIPGADQGTGGTPGPVVLVGTTGTGVHFQVNGVIDGTGVLASVGSIIDPGSYTTNPAVPLQEPVTGGGLAACNITVLMGINAIAVTVGGTYSANPASNAFTQGSTSGSGTGATFQSAIMAPAAVTVSDPGVYTTFPSNPA
jgi:hypothetical protein